MSAPASGDAAAPGGSESAALRTELSALLAVRGVAAAAVAGVDGELVAGQAKDRAQLDAVVQVITSGLAAGTALGELFDASPGDDDEREGGLGRIMLDFEGGPILITPLPEGQRVLVIVLEDAQGLGRARLAMRGALDRLERAALLP